MEAVEGGKRALAFPVRIGVADEAALEDGAYYVADCVVDNPVAEVGGADFPCFWVADREDGKRLWLVGVGEKLPLESVEVVFEIFLKACDVVFLCLALLCVQEGGAEVFVAAKDLVEVIVGLHGIRCPEGSWSHFDTVGRLVVGVDVPVVVVAEVVVAEGEKPQTVARALKTATAASLFRLFSLLCVAAVFYGRKNKRHYALACGSKASASGHEK